MSGRRRGGVLSSPDRVSRRAAERQGLSHHQRASGPAAPTHRHTHSPGRELLEVAGGLYVEARSDRGKRAGNRRSHKRTEGSSATVRRPTSQQHEPAARVSPRRVHRTSPSRTRHAAGGAQSANPHLDASFAPIEVSAAGRPPAELAARDGRFQVATPRDDSGWEPSPQTVSHPTLSLSLSRTRARARLAALCARARVCIQQCGICLTAYSQNRTSTMCAHERPGLFARLDT